MQTKTQEQAIFSKRLVMNNHSHTWYNITPSTCPWSECRVSTGAGLLTVSNLKDSPLTQAECQPPVDTESMWTPHRASTGLGSFSGVRPEWPNWPWLVKNTVTKMWNIMSDPGVWWPYSQGWWALLLVNQLMVLTNNCTVFKWKGGHKQVWSRCLPAYSPGIHSSRAAEQDGMLRTQSQAHGLQLGRQRSEERRFGGYVSPWD